MYLKFVMPKYSLNVLLNLSVCEDCNHPNYGDFPTITIVEIICLTPGDNISEVFSWTET